MTDYRVVARLDDGSWLRLAPGSGNAIEMDAFDYAGAMTFGANATSIDIGKTGITTTIKGDLQVDGATTLVGAAGLDGDVDLGDGSGDTITIGGGGDTVALGQSGDTLTMGADLDVDAGVSILMDRTADSEAVLILPDSADAPAALAKGAVRVDAAGALQWYNGASWDTAGTSSGNSLQQAYVQGNTIAATAGEGALAFSVADTQNIAVLTLTQSDSTNNPDALEISNAGSGASIQLTGTTRRIRSDSGTIWINTTTSGNIQINPTGALVVGDDGACDNAGIDATSAINIGTLAGMVAMDANINIGTASTSASRQITIGETDAGGRGSTVNLYSDKLNIDTDSATMDFRASAGGGITITGDGTVTPVKIVNGATGVLAVDLTGSGTLAAFVGGTNLANAGFANYSSGGSTAVELDLVASQVNGATGNTALKAQAFAPNGGTGTLVLEADTAIYVGSQAGTHDCDINIGVHTSGAQRTITYGTIGGSFDSAHIIQGETLDVNLNGAVTIDGGGNSNFTTTNTTAATDVTLLLKADNQGATSGDGTVQITALSTNGTAYVNVDGDVFDVDAVDAVTIDATGAGGTIGIGAAANAQTITIGNDTGATAMTLKTGTADMTFDARGMTTPITLNEAGELDLDGAFTATSLVGALNELKGEVGDVGTWTATADVTLTANDLVSVDDGGATGEISTADADGAGTKNVCVGVCTTGASAGGTATVQSSGRVTVASNASEQWSNGDLVYMDTNAGKATTTAPTSGANQQWIGVALGDGGAGTTHAIILVLGEAVAV